ncbi:MAG: T9SS type A sorting domain-containing protein [Calditrichaceae bacterium]|nr:T9SS type A sorting domain-containing protein [Calditrichaceae bacterium]
MKNLFICSQIFILLILILLIPVNTSAQYDEIQITTNESSQINPAIWDSIIVWMDLRHQPGLIPQANIYMYDLGTETETRVYSMPYHQSSPDVWEHRIVWQENGNIYMYDLLEDEHITICSASGTQSFPKIEGDYIVWQDDRSSSNTDIYLYNILDDTTIQVTDNTEIRQEYPDVSGNLVIWLQNDSLYVHDLSEGDTYPINSAVEPEDAAISGQNIVYRGYTDDAWQLFLYNLTSDKETQITHDVGSPMNPAISNAGIIWDDDRNNPGDFFSSDIYLYDLSTGVELPISIEEGRQAAPAIWENRIVWYDDRNGNNDIYMTEYEIPTGADLEVTMTDDPDPVEQDYYVNFTIQVKNMGPESATNVELDVLLPGNLEFVSITSSQGDCSQFASTGTCEIGALSKNETAVITLIAIAGGLDAVNTTATVTSDLEDPNPVNNSVTENTIVSPLTRKYFGHGWLPHIALDTQDNPHLSYTYQWPQCYLHYGNTVEGIGGDDIKHGSKTTGGWNKEIIYDGRWYSTTPPIPTFHIDNLGRTSDIAIDKNDNIHIIYMYEHKDLYAGNPVDNQSYFLRYRMNDGESWLSSKELMEFEAIVDRAYYTNGHGNPLGVWAPNIEIDSNGFVHIVFMDCEGMATQASIYYLTNVSGDWVTSILGSAYDFLDMAIDSDDHLHLSYYSVNIGIAYLTNSPDGIWQSPDTVETGWSAGQLEGMSTGIAVDPLNNPHVVYVGQTDGDGHEDVKYACKDSSGWHNEKVHDGLFQSASNAIAVDGTSTPHLCYFSLADERLYYAVKSGNNWNKIVLDDVGKSCTDITVTAEGIAHITYTNDRTEEKGKIYYVTNQEFTDSDLDGITDNNEQGPEGSNPAYDGDGNGTPDYQQKNAASFQTSDGNYYVTLVCDTSLILSDVSANNNPSSLDAPEGFGFPYGSFSFTILGLNPGDSTTVDLILPEGIILENFFKYAATHDSTFAHWYEFMYDGHTGAEINANIVTLHLIDGQRGDDDLLVNGIIREPGVPAITVTAIADNESLLPDEFSLSQNYPNPFNGQTRIKFSVPKTSKVELTIYNVLGQKIYQLVNDVMLPGRYNIVWNGKNSYGRKTASGIYFYRLKADGFVKTKKMLLVQ